MLMRIIRRSLKQWWNSDPLSAGAAMAFYAVFSIPAALILIVMFLGPILGPNLVESNLIIHVRHLFGQDTAQFIKTLIINLSTPHKTVFGSIVSLLGLLFGAVGIFTELLVSLNKLWHVPAEISSGIISKVYSYIFAFLGMIFLITLVTLSTSLSLLWSLIGIYFVHIIPQSPLFISAISALQFALILTFAFAIIYAYIPHTKVQKRAALLGGFISMILVALGKIVITFYIAKAASVSAYGAASAIIILLLYVYYASVIFFFGAALTHAIDQERIKA